MEGEEQKKQSPALQPAIVHDTCVASNVADVLWWDTKTLVSAASGGVNWSGDVRS